MENPNPQVQNPNNLTKPTVYDLKIRTKEFGKAAVDFARSIQMDTITRPLVSQLVRSATSIGANYLEADAADSPKDFRYKVALCRKEAKESLHWIEMLEHANPEKQFEAEALYDEATQLVRIFSKIIQNSER